MKFLLAAVVGCLYLASIASAENVMEKEGYYYEHRERLGHFKRSPFIDLYKTYAAAFVMPLHPDREVDDPRNYLPSGVECMLFFEDFARNEYVLEDLDQFILMDGCLGYLYDSEYHEVDSGTEESYDGKPNPSIQANNLVKSDLDRWINDETLKAIYYGTKIDEFEENAKGCIHELFEDVVRVKHQFPDKTCNNHWLQVFLDFAACHTDLPADARNTDSYVKRIYQLVNVRGKECFNAEIRSLNVALRQNYANNVFRRSSSVLSKMNIFSSKRKLKKQANERLWPWEVTRLLHAFQGTSKAINLREVHGIIRGVSINMDTSRERLMKNMAKFANEYIDPKDDSKTAADPTGAKRYDAMIDKLCNFFRSSDNKNYYDFSTPFVVMIKMLQYPEIFTISEKHFVDKILKQSFETAPLYLSVSSCNLLSFTQGRFEQKAHNSKLNYVVNFKPDTSRMVQWPNAGFS